MDARDGNCEDKSTGVGTKMKRKVVRSSVKKMIEQILSGKNACSPLLTHNTYPSLNCSRYKQPSKLISKTERKVSLPTPIFTSLSGLQEMDPCEKRVLAYRNHINRIKWLPNAHKKCQARTVYRNARKKEIYSYNVICYAELLEQNPDEYFSGRYDWYCTGGNLETFDYCEEKFVVHATGKDMRDINISKIEIDLNRIKLVKILEKEAKAITNRNKNPEILEIQKLTNTNMSVRRRNYISLYTYENDALKYCYHLCNGVVPFISSTKESHFSANILTSDLNKTVALWDLNLSAKHPKQLLFSSKNETRDRNWNCVRYLDESQYAFADFNSVYILDSRQSAKENRKFHNGCSPQNVCEVNTIVCPSNFNDLIYLASTHKLVAADRRYMGQNLKGDPYIVLQWTHQMIGYPLMLRTTVLENVEMILMSSYVNGDIRLIENNRVFLRDCDVSDGHLKSIYSSPSLPVKPPSIQDAYRKARLNGLCLNPYSYMEHRMKYGHTGINFTSCDEYLSVLISNSNGDVFSQTLVDEHEEDIVNENNLAAMKQWEDELLDIGMQNRLPLNVTAIENLVPLKKIFRCTQLDGTNVDPDIPDERIDVNLRCGKWRRSIKMLESYKDALAGSILSVWDLEQGDPIDRNSRMTFPQERSLSNGTELVDQWLEQNTTAEVDISTLKANDSSFINFLDDSMLGPGAADQSASTQKEQKKATKRKYVKGF